VHVLCGVEEVRCALEDAGADGLGGVRCILWLDMTFVTRTEMEMEMKS
jgi:hypothetical protein